MTDMLNHLRSISSDPVMCGRGNYNPETALILFDNTMVYELKNEMRIAGLLPETIWITVFNKSNSLDSERLLKSLKSELDILEPIKSVIYMPQHLSIAQTIFELLQKSKDILDLSKKEQKELIETLLVH